MKNLVRSEIIEWAQSTLSSPHPQFNGLPPCPYAANAFARDTVEIEMGFGWGYSNILRTSRKFPEDKSLVIHVELSPQMSAMEMHKDLDRLNSEKKFARGNLWFIGFHPDDDVPEFVDDDTGETQLVDEPYALIFIQKLTELDDASKRLEQKKYYTRANKEEIAHLLKRRLAREEYDNGNGTQESN
tara:strand:- start:31 stop:588 length:558 start_codon:yes stop_codon:yes gene_type:complete